MLVRNHDLRTRVRIQVESRSGTQCAEVPAVDDRLAVVRSTTRWLRDHVALLHAIPMPGVSKVKLGGCCNSGQ